MESDNNSLQTENARLILENKLLREELSELQVENEELHEHVSLLAKQISRFEEQADDDVEIDNDEEIEEGWTGGTGSSPELSWF
jgi:regulator of replication initiation timing